MVAKRLLTAEEFALLPESRQAELIDGEVVVKMPTAKGHGGIGTLLEQAIQAWMPEGAGYVTHEEGILIRRNPDQVRGPDVFYASAERLAADQNPDGAFWAIRPELVAEVVSPNETADEVRLKLRDYLSIGCDRVALIYPSTREVEVHTQDNIAKSFQADDLLEFPETLPGFSVRVSELFKLPQAALKRYSQP